MKKKFVSIMMTVTVLMSLVPMEKFIVCAAEEECADGDLEDVTSEPENIEDSSFSDEELFYVDEFSESDSDEETAYQQDTLQFSSSDDAGNSDSKTLIGMEFKLDQPEIEIVPDENMWFSGTMIWKYGTEEITEKIYIINTGIASEHEEEATLIVKDENGNIMESVGNSWWQKQIDTSYTMYFQHGDVKSNSFTVKVKHKDLSNIPLLSLGDNTVALGEYGIAPAYLWYKFVPDETAIYSFIEDYNSIAVSGIRCVDDNGNPAPYNYYIQPDEQWIGKFGGIQLIKGKNYYLGVASNIKEVCAGKISIYRVNLNDCQWKKVEDNEKDCQIGGKVTETCLVHRGETRTVTVSPKPHTPGDWVTEKGATVMETGTRIQKCTVCGKIINTQIIAKIPATFNLNVQVNRTLPMKVKQTFQVKITGLATEDSVVSWNSSNKKVATVTQHGKIKAAKKAGKSEITANLLSGAFVKFTVKVQKTDVTTSSLKVLNKITGENVAKKVTLKRKEKLILSAVTAPVTSKQKVTYESSKKSVAAVNAKGVVTAKKKGRTTIAVRSGKKVVKIQVLVK
ncbi:Ig-like domain-containing protein [Blautia ammoniilytica]|uniref:Ig-like domain-containing protein n=1 Tax=Blautia ammoniilytica TaxID=2981782 RepID=A0ABT2TYH8_9FIRM|nr:Ig-like domain-containing protein [Blautia ammoniilytica]MCU6767298.1 Ig-like domain-containing protein [Blautia ammoniilytica]SCJ16257.1 Bacterial Ig-like domain (group 2) [uncultured Blautia sp.]